MPKPQLNPHNNTLDSSNTPNLSNLKSRCSMHPVIRERDRARRCMLGHRLRHLCIRHNKHIIHSSSSTLR